MERKCKNCQNWKAFEDEPHATPVKSELHICTAAAFVVREFDDEGDFVTLTSSGPLGSDAFGCMDGSGYMGNVVTGPEFGCDKFVTIGE